MGCFFFDVCSSGSFVSFAPGYLSPSSEIKFSDVPNGLAGVTKVPAVGWFQLLGLC